MQLILTLYVNCPVSALLASAKEEKKCKYLSAAELHLPLLLCQL